MEWLLKSGTREFVIRAEVLVAGRGHDVQLQLDHESVSRRHAQFRIEDGTPTVEDLHSRNGTFVNGQPIAGRVRLAIGDRIGLGSCELELLRANAPQAFAPERATAPINRDMIDVAGAGGVLGALSPREREVFALIAEGLSQREIAEHFGVSVKTVETYRTRIGHKLGLRSRAELIRCALEAGILRPRADTR
jgi:DNA-binding CsgD family transcriptional regulator